MTGWNVALISILFCSCSLSTVNGNIVTDHVEKLLQVLEKGLTVPDINVPNVGKVSNVKIKINVSDKKLEDVELWGFSLESILKEAAISGYYDVDFEIPDILPVYGKGNFSILLKDVNVSLNIKASTKESTKEVEVSFEQFLVTLKSSKFNFENLMYDPDISKFLNQIITNAFPDLWNHFSEIQILLVQLTMTEYIQKVFYCVIYESSNLRQCLENIKVTESNVSGRDILQLIQQYKKMNKAELLDSLRK